MTQQLDPEFSRKLAKTIRPAKAPLAKGSPLGSQFFPTDGAEIRPLDLDSLTSSLGGEEFNERISWIQALAMGGYDQIALTRPKIAGDVSQIGLGVGSGWTGPKPPVASGAKALLLNRLAKAANPDSAVLVETIKSIVTQLLGLGVENVDPGVLKLKLAATIKSRPDLGVRLAKALGIQTPDVDLNLSELLAAGAKVTKEGNVLRISA